MNIAPLAVSSLRLNPHNDRHGPLRDEASAIFWMLENRHAHMRSLAKDLAESRKLFERPLVRQEGEIYTVFDGNRRTCCIKLLLNPQLAPSESWKDFFSEFDAELMNAIFSNIVCEIESDYLVIDETLFRRHTGSQEGVGQSQWDAAGKSNFLQRTGKDSIGLAETIEKVLKAEQLVDSKLDVPWSNVERLLSSESMRKRVGVSFVKGELTHLGSKKESLETLRQIVIDLSSRKVVLGDLWNNEKKGRYLDRLKSDGFSIDQAPSKRADPEAKSQNSELAQSRPRGRVPKDKNLISRVDENPFVNDPNCDRADKIWRELQFHLEFDLHDNAISVLMRVLLDIAVTFYAREQGIIFGHNDPFAKKVSSVADSMLNRGFIDQKGRSIIRKFEGDKPIVSAHSMHQYVHNANFHPGKSDLKSIWNVIRPLIINSTK